VVIDKIEDLEYRIQQANDAAKLQVTTMRSGLRSMGGELSRSERQMYRNAIETGNWATAAALLERNLDDVVDRLKDLDLATYNLDQEKIEAVLKAGIPSGGSPGGAGVDNDGRGTRRRNRGGGGGGGGSTTSSGKPPLSFQVQVQPGAVRIQGSNLDGDIDAAADRLAGRIAVQLDEHFANAVED
jgi:hypothetical protein